MTVAAWDPAGAVLVVGHSLPDEVLADIRAHTTDVAVHALDLDVDGEGADERTGQPEPESEFPASSDRAVELIDAQLTAHPEITSLLAQTRWAARDVWRVVRPRPELRGFTHVDNLRRARAGRLDIDVTNHGRRRNSHRFAAEFAGDDLAPTWDPAARARVLVGPGNRHGRAAGWARALRGLARVDAVSLAVGDDGFPADVMATSTDWESKSVRKPLLALARSATHLLLDDDESDAAVQLAAIQDVRLIRAARHDLPVAVAPGEPPDRATTPMQVVVLGDGEVDAPRTWRVTRLSDVPVSMWVPTARGADLLVDLRTPVTVDDVVLNALATGAVLVADLPRHGRFSKSVPLLASVTDPLLAGETRMRRLRGASAKYVRDLHDDQVVATRLRRVLGVR